MSTPDALVAASQDRKARLAQLKSLKRKAAPSDDTPSSPTAPSASTSNPSTDLVRATSADPTSKYLSGRNYDPETRNVKLGFEDAPIGDKTNTLEYKAQQLALEAKKVETEEQKEEKQLDLFKLQPKKPNWDLKRDLEAKLKLVDVWTENAIARMVRERVEAQKKARTEKLVEDGGSRNGGAGAGADGESEEVGMEGSELVEAMHMKEREEEADRKREEEDEQGDVS
ncbi:cwf18 pre-mRNA splicing factor-domain-containing protein [Clohesyomyces aquaticus]|uniref:Cwf18 pre-mRNA splicing factor-domain-containing protein n=1 Tax=Clohesyomyces aquaticus TaxID=1231657 RepID=A0A1Y1ZF82_9PLEO|nr:cwf18 pre-mRNA splicing factor-domain-containing protein [Clohesyomyces aquaticus]